MWKEEQSLPTLPTLYTYTHTCYYSKLTSGILVSPIGELTDFSTVPSLEPNKTLVMLKDGIYPFVEMLFIEQILCF